MKLTGSIRVQLSVSNFAVSKGFYDALMQFFEAKVVIEEPTLKYWLGGRIALTIAQCGERYRDERFAQERVGLHHVSLRVRHRHDVDHAHELVKSLNAKVVHEPGTSPWGSRYYSFEFEDPDGIRLEICHAPGRGYLDRTMTVPIRRPGKDASVTGSSCDQLDEFFDGELPPDESESFREHLPTCERCQKVLEGRMHEEVIVSQVAMHPRACESSGDETSEAAKDITDGAGPEKRS